jgi:L-aspartate semialdehyde sulfurtransferase ferredoxin
MKRTPPPRLPKAKPDAVARGKFYLTYPKKLVKEPLIYQMSRKFDLVFNVRSASVSEEIGIIALELDGRQEEIDAAVEWFRAQGVTVEPIEKNIIE